jgi:hypothetical protein
MKTPRILIYGLFLLVAGCTDQCDTLLRADFTGDTVGSTPTRNLTNPTVPNGIGYPADASYLTVFNTGTAAAPNKALCFKNGPGSATNRLVFAADNASVSSGYVVFAFTLTPHLSGGGRIRVEFSDTNALNDNTLLSAFEIHGGDTQLFADLSMPSSTAPGGYTMDADGLFLHQPDDVPYVFFVNYNLATHRVRYSILVGGRSLTREHDAIHNVNPLKPRMALVYPFGGNAPADCNAGPSVLLDDVFFYKKREAMMGH